MWVLNPISIDMTSRRNNLTIAAVHESSAEDISSSNPQDELRCHLKHYNSKRACSNWREKVEKLEHKVSLPINDSGS